jgi:hypothetical protein
MRTEKSPKADPTVVKSKNPNTKRRKAFHLAEASHQEIPVHRENQEDHEDLMMKNTIKESTIDKEKTLIKRIAKIIEGTIKRMIIKTIERKIVKIKEKTITRNHGKISIKRIAKSSIDSIRTIEKMIIKRIRKVIIMRIKRAIIKIIAEGNTDDKTPIGKSPSDNPVNKTADNPTRDSVPVNNTSPAYNSELRTSSYNHTQNNNTITVISPRHYSP